MDPRVTRSLREIIDAALRGQLDKTLAHKLHELGPEAVAVAMLATCRRIAELEKRRDSAKPSPSTPSGMVPIYTKPNARKRRKKPGARDGHDGVRRARPTKIDRHETHRLKCCPHCRRGDAGDVPTHCRT